MTRRDLFAAGAGAASMAAVFITLHWLTGPGDLAGRGLNASSTQPDVVGTTTVSAGDDEAWRTANANLAETVRLTQERLDQHDEMKRALEAELKAAKAKLAAAERDGALARSEYDLSQDDWKALAATGTVKARYPCPPNGDWHISPAQVQSLGLSPADAATLEQAYMNEADHIASAIQPGCAKVLGNAELARRLGKGVCTAVISESVKDDHADIQLVADIHAGNVPMPDPATLDPFATMILAQSSATEALQADLSKTFGPEEAHRLAFADELGACSGTWSGPPAR